MQPVVQIENLSKVYRLGEFEVRALNNVNFSIKRGEFVAVMGASGSGKSTLLNILGCLDRPSAGRYLLEGTDVASLDEQAIAAVRSQRVGFVFQSFNLLARTSALENVELPLFYAASSDGGPTRAQELLHMVGLSGREQSHPSQLSGGQQQRVAIARALVNNPTILLADEPTGNLDTRNSAEIMQIISRLNRESGITVILVTHETDIASYADRTVTFRDGVIVSDVRKERTADEPSRPFAALHTQTPPAGTPSPAAEAWRFGAMAFAAAARALSRNKMRAALTALGIFIGVAAVVAMVAVGDGARASVQAQIQSLGTNLLVVLPGATTAAGVRAGLGSASTLTVADAEAIVQRDRAVALVSYVIRQIAQVVAADRNWSTSVTGTTVSYLGIRDWPLESGRPFTEAEVKSAAGVCLLGRTVVRNLFGEQQNPLGAVIRVRNFPLRVIGVLAQKGQTSWGQDQDDVILIPFSTAERKVLGVATATPAPQGTPSVFGSVGVNPLSGPPKITGVVNVIYAKARSAALVNTAMDQMRRTLHERHRIAPGHDDDFTVRSLNEIAEASESASRVMTTLLAAVASISLVVGGIGIMNIMLVSVTERTREIGIRMAVGARRIHILLQFLVEALMLSVVGGLLGAGLGVAVSKAISMVAGWPTLLSPLAVLGGFTFSAAVGIFFGFYPARKASMLNPIEALRYE